MSESTSEALARVVADALYKHRYPRAMSGVEGRGHPSHNKFWKEADAVLRAMYRISPAILVGDGIPL